jgi:hypothetical protein
MANTTMQIYRGDTVHRLCTFTKNGSPMPINNLELFFTAKTNRSDDDDDAVIQKKITIPDDALASSGKCYFDLDETETAIPVGSYWYDFQLVDDVNSTVTTLGVGKLKILQDVTLTIT